MAAPDDSLSTDLPTVSPPDDSPESTAVPDEFATRIPPDNSRPPSTFDPHATRQTDEPPTWTPPLGVAGPRLSLPCEFGNYVLLEELGAGGMGVVYKARQKSPDRLVALKMIRSAHLASEDDIRRFRQEADLAASLDHPNLVPVYDFGEIGGQHYFSMKLVPGLPLSGRAATYRDKPRDAARLLATVARAVHHAHQRQLLHRDLKPGNILLDESGQPHVADFGLARRLDAEGATLSGAIVGTPSYMAPEQARGQKRLTTAADVYALGAILYSLLTGRPPFQGEDMMETLQQVVSQEPPSPRSLNPKTPRDLETICLKCLAKDPKRRYGSAEALAEDLEHWLHGEPVQARAAGRIERAWGWCRRNPALAGSLAAAALLLVAGATTATVFAHRAESEADQARKAQREAARTASEEKMARDRESQERQRAEALLYSSRLALAQQLWTQGKAEPALLLLDEITEHRNDWEHRYLHTLMYKGQRTFRGHTGEVTEVSFSPDGRSLASASSDNSVRIWDIVSGQAMRTFHGYANVTFSPDGRRIGLAGPARELKLCDARTGQELLALRGAGNRLTGICFSPDGSRFAAASTSSNTATAPTDPASGGITIWDAQSGKVVLSKKSNLVDSICFSPDGKRLVVFDGMPATLTILDAQSGQELLILPTREIIRSVCFSSDGRRIALACVNQSVRVWDATSGQELLNLKGHTDSVNAVAFSPDGRRLVSGSSDRTVRLWDVASGRELRTFKGHVNEVMGACFSPDGRWLASASRDETVKLWDVESEENSIRFNKQYGPLNDISFSPDGKRFASAREFDSVIVANVDDDRDPAVLKGHTGGVTSVCFSADGKSLATGGGDWTVRLWDASTGREKIVLSGHTGPVTHVSFSRDSQQLASVSEDRTVRLWDVQTAKAVLTLNGNETEYFCVCFSPDGRRLAAGGNSSVQLWDVDSGKELLGLNGHAGWVSSVCFSADGRRLVSASTDRTAMMWDVQSGHKLLTFKGHSGGISRACFSADGSRLATAGEDETVRIWDVHSGQALLTLSGHSGAVSGVAFDRDGGRLASASLDGTVRLWDARSTQDFRYLTGHTELVNDVCFSPSGEQLASAGQDQTVRVWHVRSGAQVHTLTGHTDVVERVCFCPDGRFVASMSREQVRLWNAASGQHLSTFQRPRTEPSRNDLIAYTTIALQNQPLVAQACLSYRLGPGAMQSARWYTPTANLFFEMNGRRIVSKSAPGKWYVHDVSSGQLVGDVPDPPIEPVGNSRISAGGKLFAEPAGDRIRLHRMGVSLAELADARRWIEPDFPWHEEQARLAEDAEDWHAAEFHLSRLVRNRCLDRGFHVRRAHALSRLGMGELAYRHGVCAVLLCPEAGLRYGLIGHGWTGLLGRIDRTPTSAGTFQALSELLLVQTALSLDAECERTIVRMLDEFEAMPDFTEFLLVNCASVPTSSKTADRLVRLAEKLVDRRRSERHLVLKGASLFRAKRHNDAMETLVAARAMNDEGATAETILYLAMAHQGLGQRELARDHLETFQAWFKTNKMESWQERVFWRQQLEAARAMILAMPKSRD